MNNFDQELIKKYLPKEKWEDSFRKLDEGYPVQYIIGNVDFYGCTIEVNENVLIPRFETEYLVDDLLKLLNKYDFVNPNILDIGTGSGCISISLKKNINSNVVAIDKSKQAIEVAYQNAKNNNSDITFKNISIEEYNSDVKFDVIVSNPPYIPLDGKVDDKTKYEPQMALFAEENGLYFYRIMLEKSLSLLNKKSIMAFEIGFNQADDIKDMIKKYYPNAIIEAKNDLNGFNRYIYVINE